MGNERYNVKISGASMTFDFISEGPKGLIRKRVQYRKFKRKNIYNLGFGDLNLETNAIDDKVITDNKDGVKVLSTVASTVFTFIKNIRRLLFMQKVAMQREHVFTVSAFLITSTH